MIYIDDYPVCRPWTCAQDPDPPKRPTMTTYVDDHLLTRAQADDPLAVRTLAAIAAQALAPLVPRQPALAWLLTVAERLAKGETVPNPLALPVEQPGTGAYEASTLSLWVWTLMQEHGYSQEDAIALVARLYPGAEDDSDWTGRVTAAWERYQGSEELPPDLYPIAPDALARMEAFEGRMVAYLSGN